MPVKDKSKLLDYPDEVKSEKWVNVYFMKDGSCKKSPMVHPTEERAAECMKIFLAPIPDRPNATGVILEGTDFGIKYKEFSFGIQMPVKE